MTSNSLLDDKLKSIIKILKFELRLLTRYDSASSDFNSKVENSSTLR